MSLLGTWVVDSSDHRTVAELGDVLLDFREGGQLVYTVRGPSKDEIINLSYKIEGSTITTDQPSSPRPEQTTFSLSPDGVLTLEFGGIPYRFRREWGDFTEALKDPKGF